MGMGLVDRDYMGENFVKNPGLRWNDQRSRIEMDSAVIQQPVRMPADPVRGWIRLIVIALFVGGAGGLIIGLVAMRRDAKLPFPQSGSVTVANSYEPGHLMSKLDVRSGSDNAVLQFYDVETRSHVMSIYMAAHEKRLVPLPVGTYALRIAYGSDWYGFKNLFGKSTKFVLVRRQLAFGVGYGHVITLEQKGGNVLADPQK